MEWAKGYVADIGYTASFFRELTPAHVAFAALSVGRSPGRALRPKRVLELGFGQGFGLTLLAAANPDVQFEGIDFNPEHVAHAGRLIRDANLTNVTVSEQSFEETATRGGANDVDMIVLHGIISWVGLDDVDSIVTIARNRLQPNGMLYVSYNSNPGWAPLEPIRQYMLQVKKRNPGRPSHNQLALGNDLLSKLKSANAYYFTSNPAAGQHLDGLMRHDSNYLAHEYLDQNWNLFYFPEVLERFSVAKLSYVCSATLLENTNNYAVPEPVRGIIASIEDPVLQELTRDYAVNKRFRRDIYARGTGALTNTEHRRLLSGLRFALLVPRRNVTLKFGMPIGEVTGFEELYNPILDLLDQKIASFDELLALPPFGEAKAVTLLDCLTVLVNSGQVHPITAQEPIDTEPAKRFNQSVVAHAKAGRFYGHLACPATASGFGVSDFGLLTLAAIADGKADDVATLAKYALDMIKSCGRRPIKDGKIIDKDDDGILFLQEVMGPVLELNVPMWRRLGVI